MSLQVPVWLVLYEGSLSVWQMRVHSLYTRITFLPRINLRKEIVMSVVSLVIKAVMPVDQNSKVRISPQIYQPPRVLSQNVIAWDLRLKITNVQ